MNKFFISVETVLQVLNACYGMQSSNETGGIFIGPSNEDNVITHAVPSSSYAERGLVTYFQTEADVKILNKKLRQFQVKGEDFKGYWHKHPSGLTRLSGGDINTCHEILTDPAYNINNSLIMTVISEEGHGNMPLHSYHVSLKNGSVVVEDVAMVILPLICLRTVWLNHACTTQKGHCYESNNSR